jgi:hypothetical protein
MTSGEGGGGGAMPIVEQLHSDEPRSRDEAIGVHVKQRFDDAPIVAFDIGQQQIDARRALLVDYAPQRRATRCYRLEAIVSIDSGSSCSFVSIVLQSIEMSCSGYQTNFGYAM